jgi:hypothetical protein
VAIGLGILMAGSVAGALLVPPSSEPGRDPEGPASAAQPTGADRELDATAGSPAPATLAAEDAQRLGEAVAARGVGDLERSQRILQDLVDRDPGHTAAAELLQQVEAQLWARDALPLEYRAKHNHRIGSCSGQLTIEADALAYRSRDHGLWRWGFDELEEMRRKNRRELELVTRENDALRLGSGKHYDFELQGATLDADDWGRLRILIRGG